jgi:hypothetical protein
MARVTARSSTSDPQQQLTDAIATKKQQLRLLEARLRDEEKAQRQERYITAGKVVEACGLLDVDAGELARILQRRKSGETAAYCSSSQAQRDRKNPVPAAHVLRAQRGSGIWCHDGVHV